MNQKQRPADRSMMIIGENYRKSFRSLKAKISGYGNPVGNHTSDEPVNKEASELLKRVEVRGTMMA